MRSTSPYGRLITRPTSRIAARAPIVPNVMICATRSAPYLSTTYLMTSSRRLSMKSTSMSGIVYRSRFRNRSNGSRYAIGSTSVTPHEYSTRLPAADPRTVVRMPLRRAKLTKSWTIRK